MVASISVLLGTGNAHKRQEVAEIWRDYPELHLLDVDLQHLGEPPEDGATYRENALQKARFYYEQTGLPCVADDSGLEVEALGWKPGIHTKRFSPPGSTPQEKLQHMLAQMQGFPLPEQRRARYRCTAVAYGFTPEPLYAEGTLEGIIANTPQGEGGFGYDPLFRVAGSTQTLAQQSAQYKNSLSHRGQAMRKLAALLLQLKG